MACRNRKGQFTSRCSFKGLSGRKRGKVGGKCKFGVNKRTGRCLKHKRARRR